MKKKELKKLVVKVRAKLAAAREVIGNLEGEQKESARVLEVTRKELDCQKAAADILAAENDRLHKQLEEANLALKAANGRLENIEQTHREHLAQVELKYELEEKALKGQLKILELAFRERDAKNDGFPELEPVAPMKARKPGFLARIFSA